MGGNHILQTTNYAIKTSTHMLVSSPRRIKTLVIIKAP